MSSSRFISRESLQRDSQSLIREISNSGEACYITENGKATAVLVDINKYHALMDLVEESETPATHELSPVTRKQTSIRVILEKSKGFTKQRR